jgi:hypothetical protein
MFGLSTDGKQAVRKTNGWISFSWLKLGRLNISQKLGADVTSLVV